MSEICQISQLLDDLSREHSSESSSHLLEQLMPLVYEELRALARSNRYRWQGGAGVGTTSLVHEAYLKIVRGQPLGCASRGRFFALASKAMRSILIDNARWHQRKKRNSGEREISFDNVELVSADRSDDLLALDDALVRLETQQSDLADVVVLRIFGGLTVDESAETLAVSQATVKRRWTLAKAWLYRELNRPDASAQDLPA